MDTFEAVMLIENGNAEDEQVIEAFQALIDSGIVWQLQGCYGRTATDLLRQGLCRLPQEETPHAF